MIWPRTLLIWCVLGTAIGLPITLSLFSPLLAWRDWIYIVAGLCGITAFAILLVQPLLIGGYLPGLSPLSKVRLHRWFGILLVTLVVGHVLGLWITSPPDVVDALLFRSPTPFSAWGVVAMWSVLAASILVAFRKRIRSGYWRNLHRLLVTVTVVGTIVHALLIEGTMETVSKAVFSLLVALALAKVLTDRLIRK